MWKPGRRGRVEPPRSPNGDQSRSEGIQRPATKVTVESTRHRQGGCQARRAGQGGKSHQQNRTGRDGQGSRWQKAYQQRETTRSRKIVTGALPSGKVGTRPSRPWRPPRQRDHAAGTGRASQVEPADATSRATRSTTRIVCHVSRACCNSFPSNPFTEHQVSVGEVGRGGVGEKVEVVVNGDGVAGTRGGGGASWRRTNGSGRWCGG